MTDSHPPVPLFGPLVTSTALAHAVFTASIPLLPAILPNTCTILDSAYVLTFFILPSLFAYPLVTCKHTSPNLTLVLISGALFQALSPLVLALCLVFFHVAYPGVPLPVPQIWHVPNAVHVMPHTVLAFVSFAMFLSGLGAVMCQFGLVRLVAERLKPLHVASRKQTIGVHLAVMEGCIALGAIIMPPLFALAVTKTNLTYLPYAIVSVLQLPLAIYIACALPQYDEYPSVQQRVMIADDSAAQFYGSITDHRYAKQLPTYMQTEEEEGAENDAAEPDPGILHALRHPWVWMILFSIIISAASASFLRPILTPRVTNELHDSTLKAAYLFSLCALTRIATESFASALLSTRLGIRNAIVLGLLICFSAFRVLLHKSYTALGVVLLIAGSSGSLVMSLSDLSQTTGVSVQGITNSLSSLAAFTFSLGEVLGTLAAGFFAALSTSLQDALLKWSRVVLVSCAIVGAPYLVGITIQCLQPWSFLTSFSTPLPTDSNCERGSD